MPRQMWQQKAEDGVTALHFATLAGHLAVVQWLVQDAKADVAAVAENGATALHYAAHHGQLAVVQWLVQDAQADVAAKAGRWLLLY